MYKAKIKKQPQLKVKVVAKGRSAHHLLKKLGLGPQPETSYPTQRGA